MPCICYRNWEQENSFDGYKWRTILTRRSVHKADVLMLGADAAIGKEYCQCNELTTFDIYFSNICSCWIWSKRPNWHSNTPHTHTQTHRAKRTRIFLERNFLSGARLCLVGISHFHVLLYCWWPAAQNLPGQNKIRAFDWICDALSMCPNKGNRTPTHTHINSSNDYEPLSISGLDVQHWLNNKFIFLWFVFCFYYCNNY